MAEFVPRLVAPFLPAETRHRLRQQRLDAEAAEQAARVLPLPGVSVTVLRETIGAGSWREFTLVPTPDFPHSYARWFTEGALAWDGTTLTVTGDHATPAAWRTTKGGVKPGFAAHEVAAAEARPATSGECPDTVAEIAAVAIGDGRARRLYFLDDESRRLTMTPARGFTDDQLADLAQHAGITLRTYSLTTGGRTTPDALCEILFPRSARRRSVIAEGNPVAEWRWQGWP